MSWPIKFFKVILDVQSPRLILPPQLRINLRRLRTRLPRTIQLCIPNGQEFPISVVNTAEGVYFGRGWPEFRDHHNVRHGFFLVFEWDGDTTMEVHIFDHSAMPINYDPFIGAEHNDADDVEPNLGEDNENGEQQALRAATAYMEQLPVGVVSFVKKMVPSFLTGDCVLNVPKSQVQLPLHPSRLCFVKLRVVQGRGGGSVDCVVSIGNGRARLTSGWKRIIKEEDLKVGDHVVIQFHLNEPIMWDVTIFRS